VCVCVCVCVCVREREREREREGEREKESVCLGSRAAPGQNHCTSPLSSLVCSVHPSGHGNGHTCWGALFLEPKFDSKEQGPWQWWVSPVVSTLPATGERAALHRDSPCVLMLSSCFSVWCLTWKQTLLILPHKNQTTVT
jgi:hypothetical protein